MKIDPSQVTNRLTASLEDQGFVDFWFFHLIDKKLAHLCESPIEAMLGAALLFNDRFSQISFNPLILAGQDEVPTWPPETRLLIPQFKLGDYRIDWLYRDGPLLTFIECDGHDFHEKTKGQAARDKKRDREIQAHGPILRFTGSEIWADPFHCAYQIEQFVDDRHVPAELRSNA